MYRTFLFLLFLTMSFLSGCGTPVAVRSLSGQLVTTQRAYAVSLHGYFAAVEKFADAQVTIAETRIDELTAEINRQYGTRASASIAATPDQRQKIIDQLVKDVTANANADAPLKQKIAAAVASLKKKNQELDAAYQPIVAASAKLDEYIRLKKADEAAISSLVQTVGLNSQKIPAIVDAIVNLTQDLTQTSANPQPQP
jgi:DNA repair exonuclease SbcCD ATPase subunit